MVRAIDGPLLVSGEQGLGDQILLASMLPDLAERVCEITVEVEPRLVPLLIRSFPELNIVARGGRAPFTTARPLRKFRWQVSAAISGSTGRPFPIERTAICDATRICPINCADGSPMVAQSSACRGPAAIPVMKCPRARGLHAFEPR